MRMDARAALLGLALVAAHAAPARAEDYPARPVTVVSPYAAGGGIDLLARLLASRLEQRLGRPFALENKAGAATPIAATAGPPAAAARAASAVAHAAPDGYTILLAPRPPRARYVSMAKRLPSGPASRFARETL